MEHLKTQIIDKILIVTLNRPTYSNALNNKIRDELENVFSSTKNDGKIAAILLTAEGKHFCSGYDLEEVISTNLASFRHRALEYHYELYSYPKPIVTLLKGFCSAGGFDLALCGDYIIAEEKTILYRPEIKFGAPPLMITLARKVGASKALSLSLSGDKISSSEALRLGIINEVYSGDSPVAHAVKVASKLSQWDSGLTGILKEISNNHFNGNLYENFKKEFLIFEQFLDKPGFLEHLKTYAGKILQKKE